MFCSAVNTKFQNDQVTGTYRNSSNIISKNATEPLYLGEGLFAVNKPSNWTSQNVVSCIRKIFELNARRRGVMTKGGKKRITVGRVPSTVKVGHGGTLDPLAKGVLVIGVGNGTKMLKEYLEGTKKYKIRSIFGIQTDTLDLEGKIEKTAPFQHITHDAIAEILPQFTGSITQVPPIYSAIKRNGKKLYEIARNASLNDQSIEHIEIPERIVQIYSLELSQYYHEIKKEENNLLQEFEFVVECSGGTYMRSLVRDMALKLGSVATMSDLVRLKQGPFELEDSIEKNDWSVETFVEAIETSRHKFKL